jgi:hypothetical protein
MCELRQMPAAAAAAEAPHLVCLADELGLVQLRRGAVAFISQHYNQVQVSKSSGVHVSCCKGRRTGPEVMSVDWR